MNKTVLPPLFACLLLSLSCGEGTRLRSTRGYILISLDTLRADHLSLYGYGKPTSPFLEELASKAAVFDTAIAQYPSTLTSHMSLFTGLYPLEHGVYPPRATLADEIPTFPELFQQAGFRTAGFTEGGFMEGRFGFRRGFEVFRDDAARTPLDVEETLRRGLAFLESLGKDEKYLLLLHTYAIHSPYDPPSAFAARFWASAAPDTFPPDAPNLERFNLLGGPLPPRTREYFEALYDAQILQVDTLLRSFFAHLERLRLQEDATIIILSDHGEEFLEHGRFGHTQIFYETLHVPLIVLHPDLQRPLRVQRPVELLDVTRTLLDVARLKSPDHLSGESLVPDLLGKGPERAEAYAELDKGLLRSLVWGHSTAAHQLLLTRRRAGDWLSRSVTFDLPPGTAGFAIQSFQEQRPATLRIAGQDARTLQLPADRLLTVEVPPTEAPRRVTVEASCSVPASNRRRCFSFRIAQPPLQRVDLFDVLADPTAQRDLSARLPDLLRQGGQRLARYRFRTLAQPTQPALDRGLERHLRALGYLE